MPETPAGCRDGSNPAEPVVDDSLTTIAIDSIDDPRLGPYRHLKRNNDTHRSRLFVVEGDKLVERLLASRFRLHSLLFGRRYWQRISLAIPGQIPVYLVDDKQIEELVGFNFHRGALACAFRAELDGRWQYLQALDAACAPATGRPAVVVVCPAVHDPENLGSLLRTSAAFGATAMLAGEQSADPLSRRVLRVSMGASLSLPIWRTDNLEHALAELRERWSFERLAAVPDSGAEFLPAIETGVRIALVLGSEGPGLDPRWLAACDRAVRIPMQAGTDSLNVAVAGGILLYHLCASHLAPQDPLGKPTVEPNPGLEAASIARHGL
ncbi:MAG: RNA methyltransferase [Pirellulales bacterium]|nr:RNA methyltransferase [Pirellulales bacterium]